MVVLPIRSFRSGKTRLADSVSAVERAVLVRRWAETVVAAAHDLPVLVVSDDMGVLQWADEHELRSMRPSEPGLNQAATAGRDHARHEGHTRVMIAHADLPMARDLRPVFDATGDVVIVPDLAHDGTNVLVVPSDDRFTFCYGPGSFIAHHREARRLGWSCSVVEDPELAVDIDDAADLATLPGRFAP